MKNRAANRSTICIGHLFLKISFDKKHCLKILVQENGIA